jgi:hypothetical protein
MDDEYNYVKEEPLESDTITLENVTKPFELKFSDTEKIDTQIFHFYDNDSDKYLVGFKSQEKIFEFKVKKKTYNRTYRLDKQKVFISVRDHHGDDVAIKDNEKSLKEEFSEAFLLNINSFFVALYGNKLSCGTKNYELTGTSWIEIKQTDDNNKNSDDSEVERIKISDKLSLAKSEENACWKLFSHDKSIFDFKTKDANRIQIAYPAYIAYMRDSESDVYILPFEQESVGKECFLTKANYILPGGNAYLLAVKDLTC